MVCGSDERQDDGDAPSVVATSAIVLRWTAEASISWMQSKPIPGRVDILSVTFDAAGLGAMDEVNQFQLSLGDTLPTTQAEQDAQEQVFDQIVDASGRENRFGLPGTNSQAAIVGRFRVNPNGRKFIGSMLAAGGLRNSGSMTIVYERVVG